MEVTSATLLMQLKLDGPLREIAWSEFRRRYAPVIAGFALNLGVRPQDVDDIVQGVLTGFYAAHPRFVYDPAKGRFRGYLKTCVVHSLSRRGGGGSGGAGRLMIEGRAIEEIEPADESMERAWNASWEREQLQRAIEDVRRHYEDNVTFQAFQRVAIDGRPAGEVAAELALSLDAVYQAKSRCTARLRSMLRQLEDEEG